MIEERITLGISPIEVVQEHICRYKYATNFAEGKIILDAACGTGYGTYMLSRTAKEVTGIDLSEDAIHKAKTIYSAENIKYVQADIKNLPFQDNTFDLVVSFETIEHIPEYKIFLKECKRVLKPKGRLIISTPNALISSPQGTIINPYHVVEFKPEEFTNILLEQFPQVDLYGQRPIDSKKNELLTKWTAIKKQIKPLGVAIQTLRAIISLMKTTPIKNTTPNYPVAYFQNGTIKSAYLIAVCQKPQI